MADFALWPLIEPAGIDDYLAGWIKLDVRAVHRARGRPFEVYSFAGITAPVARAFEFVLAGFPIGRAAQVCAARVNDKQSFGVADHPHAILLLEFCIDSEPEIGRIAYAKDCAGLKNGSREKEA